MRELRFLEPYTQLHGILSPYKDGEEGFIVQSQWAVCLFIWTVGKLLRMGGVSIRDFPGGTPVPISCPTGKRRTQVYRSVNKLSQRSLYNQVCRF